MDREVLAYETYAYIGAMFVIIKNWNIPNVRPSIFLLKSARMLTQCSEKLMSHSYMH